MTRFEWLQATSKEEAADCIANLLNWSISEACAYYNQMPPYWAYLTKEDILEILDRPVEKDVIAE